MRFSRHDLHVPRWVGELRRNCINALRQDTDTTVHTVVVPRTVYEFYYCTCSTS